MKGFKYKKILKPYFLIPLIIIVIVVLSFVFWYIKPSKKLSVAVLDKTVPATAADTTAYEDNVSNYYRKHIGLFWLLDYLKVKNTETNKLYNYKTDYYGPQLNKNNEIESDKSITNIKNIPDLLYLADSYGVEIYDDHGITSDEMNTVSYCYSSGSTVIGEQDILTTATDEKVSEQLQNLFGISSTGWVGRYIFDLQDLTDVPYWAPDMWRAKYGQEWNCTGPGILLVSSDGDILVLEEQNDFKSKNMFKISIEKKFRKEFGKHSLNFYNWFELIEANKSTDVIATYNFNLNSTGAEKFATVSDTTTFAAVTRSINDSGTPAYYFAGDFNDYTTKLNIYNFMFADRLFRFISFDRDGDVTNFYWNFYEPVMKKIIKNLGKEDIQSDSTEKDVQVSRVKSDGFEISDNGKWEKLTIKGFNINGEAPGNSGNTYSRDFSYYSKLLSTVDDMGGNCIRTYDLLPPEFYRALVEHNKSSKNQIYLIQGILAPDTIKGSDLISNKSDMKKEIDYVIKAVNGKGNISATKYHSEASYSYNALKYVIAYIIDPGFQESDTDKLIAESNQSAYSGKYISGESNAVEAISAELCDYTLGYLEKAYGFMTPVSICSNAERLSGAFWVEDDKMPYAYNLSNLNISKKAETYYFTSYSLLSDDVVLISRNAQFASHYNDSKGDFAYGGYISEVKKLLKGPVLIDRAGLSANNNLFEAESDVNGLSEKDQGEGIVRMLNAASENGYIGTLIADLNDNWSASDSVAEKYTLAVNDGLWHDITDRKETTGVVAVESKEPSSVAMELNDNAESSMLKQIQLSYNKAYMYITLLLKHDIDFDSNQLIVGIDTYQRNNGEYFYDKNFYANSQSGMEYIIRFESKSSASLYVTHSYDRNIGNFSTQESYNAEYDLVSVLKYGNFTTSTANFYQSGVTVKMRIPWAMLNFADPSKQLVIDGEEGGKVKTTVTDGMIFSVLVGNKQDKDTDYIFPESKKSAGYKRLVLEGWDAVNIEYNIRIKESGTFIKNYFDSIKK